MEKKLMIHDNFFFFFKISLWMLISSQTIISQFFGKIKLLLMNFIFLFQTSLRISTTNKHCISKTRKKDISPRDKEN